MRTSPPPAYTSTPRSPSTPEAGNERTPLCGSSRPRSSCDHSVHAHTRSELHVRFVGSESHGGLHEYVCAFCFSLLIVFTAGWVLSWLVHSPKSSPVEVKPSNPPPTFLSLAPNLSINADRSASTWLLPYYNIDSPSFVSDANGSIVVLSNQTRSTPSSLARLYVETWSSGGGSEVTLEISSTCSLYAVDLHVGPHCAKKEEDQEEEDCSSIFATMQTYADLEKCVESGRKGVGIKRFFLGVSRMGNLYSLEQRGFKNGTDLVPRENEQGFDWSWAVGRQPDYSHPQPPKQKLDVSAGESRSVPLAVAIAAFGLLITLCLV
ncbi:hypothetical protein JCM5350_004186 [Sporobolomyces pararoseus]